MRILVGHNHYQQPGGEDFLVRCEINMLRQHGHEVYTYERHNDELKAGWMGKARQMMSLRFSRATYRHIHDIIQSFRPDVAHFHNTFYMITPSAFKACRDLGVPVVVSLHNYRLMCLNGLLFRQGRVCEDCLKGVRALGIIHRCHQDSWIVSAVLDDMIAHHWRQKTWVNLVDQYVVATEFSREKHVQVGIPVDQLNVVPHFVEDPGRVVSPSMRGTYALYAGRLSEEKGIRFLLKAWENLKEIPLYIVGQGPLGDYVKRYIQEHGLSHIVMAGYLERQAYLQKIAQAKFLVVPGLCYDNFPMVMVEAFSYGVPVVASRLGTLAACMRDGETGLLYKPDDVEDFALKARDMIKDQAAYEHMCFLTRRTFETLYTAKHHYASLMKVYENLS